MVESSSFVPQSRDYSESFREQAGVTGESREAEFKPTLNAQRRTPNSNGGRMRLRHQKSNIAGLQRCQLSSTAFSDSILPHVQSIDSELTICL